jgi:hypothetical protein
MDAGEVGEDEMSMEDLENDVQFYNEMCDGAGIEPEDEMSMEDLENDVEAYKAMMWDEVPGFDNPFETDERF